LRQAPGVKNSRQVPAPAGPTDTKEAFQGHLEAGHDRAAIEDVGHGHDSDLIRCLENVNATPVGIDEPDQTDTALEILVDPLEHVCGPIGRADDFDDQVGDDIPGIVLE